MYDPNGCPPIEVVLDADDPKTSYVAPPYNEEEKNRPVESWGKMAVLSVSFTRYIGGWRQNAAAILFTYQKKAKIHTGEQTLNIKHKQHLLI